MRDASQLLRWRQRYDPDGFLLDRSRASLRWPQCFSFRRDGSNTRSTCRFRALITPIRANMVGPPRGSGKSRTVASLMRWSIEAAAEKARSVGARFIILDPNGEYRECFKDLTQFVDVRVFSGEPRPGERELIVPAWMWNGQEWAGAVAASPGTQRPVLMQAIRHLRSYGRQSLTTPQSVSMHLKITSSLKSGERQALA